MGLPTFRVYYFVRNGYIKSLPRTPLAAAGSPAWRVPLGEVLKILRTGHLKLPDWNPSYRQVVDLP